MNGKHVRIPYSLEIMFLMLAVLWLTCSPGNALGAMDSLSTGVGIGTRTSHPEYGLKLEFTLRAGNYLSEVDVDIYRNGKIVKNIHSPGPWLFVDLEPGDYSVVASLADGRKQGTRFSVTAGRQTQVILSWPAME
jgi:hypothetical protein